MIYKNNVRFYLQLPGGIVSMKSTALLYFYWNEKQHNKLLDFVWISLSINALSKYEIDVHI